MTEIRNYSSLIDIHSNVNTYALIYGNPNGDIQQTTN